MAYMRDKNGRRLDSIAILSDVEQKAAFVAPDDPRLTDARAPTSAALASITTSINLQQATGVLVSRMSVRPSRARQTLISSLISSLMAAGVWDKLDGLYVAATTDQQIAKLNWVGAGQDLVAYNSPAFTPDRGFTLDGTTNYFSTSLPANAADKFKAADASWGYWTSTTSAGTWQDLSGGGSTYLNSRNTSGMIQSRLNDGSGAVVQQPWGGTAGFASVSRDASNVYTYKSGALVGTDARGSQALTTAPFLIGRDNGATLYSPRQFTAAYIGGGLSGAEMSFLYGALRTYLVAVGATT